MRNSTSDMSDDWRTGNGQYGYIPLRVMRAFDLISTILVVIVTLALLAATIMPQMSLAQAREVWTGIASVVDGDTIDLETGAGRLRVRLHAVDAPEDGQTCHSAAGEPYPCGDHARAVLSQLLDGKSVTCVQTQRPDRYKRQVARCADDATKLDVAEIMVRNGMALAFRRYGEDYITAETLARAEKRGMWQGVFTPPWDHRKGK